MKFKTKRSEVLEFAPRKGRYVVGMHASKKCLMQ